MTNEEIATRINNWEGEKMWARLAKPPDIDTDDYTRGKAVLDKLFKKWRGKLK